jgi:hypothetical protein
VEQITGTTSADPPAHAPARGQPDAAAGSHDPPGFQSRGRARRRARFLRKARELAYRDLGGLVFNLHRFGARNDALVLAKLTTLGHIDAELRAIESALEERRPVTVLREAGITACPRCAAIHSSEDGFCPNCGLSMGRHVDLPAGFQSAAGAPAAVQATAAAVATAPAPAPVASPPSSGPPDPAPAQAPARASSKASAPPAPSTPPVGRSPAPPSTSGTSSPTPPSQAPAGPIEEDGPTEILGPPASSS